MHTHTLMLVYESACVCLTTINEQRDHEIKKSKEAYMGRFGGRKRVGGKCNHIIIISQTKRNN